ncbi:serine hydrolase [Streptomyces sp. NPDC059918]|uniref:serine hydrolase n=1 Tax=unclassified Streptomyces TaxID=2593676 RepID=UPI003665302B
MAWRDAILLKQVYAYGTRRREAAMLDLVYSNTNYVLLGMVVKAVTGRSWDDEVRARILRPLHLTRTFTPGDQPFLPGSHARDYQQFEPGGAMTDTTVAYLPFDGEAEGTPPRSSRHWWEVGSWPLPSGPRSSARSTCPRATGTRRAHVTGSECFGRRCRAGAGTGDTTAPDSVTWCGLP